jgi:hypothetical protein
MTTQERTARRARFCREADYHLDQAHALGIQVDTIRDAYLAAGGVKAPYDHPATIAYIGSGDARVLIARERAHCREAGALLRAVALLAREC